MNTTHIDAAPTPAPVFAYRAFRSLFVPSPMSSPVAQDKSALLDTNTDSEMSDDEDLQHSPSRPSRFTASPSKSSLKMKRKEENRETSNGPFDNVELRLTPKRQKIQQMSPSKSILKTKNTPRRDPTITVAFKSASKSPDIFRKPRIHVRSRPDKVDRQGQDLKPTKNATKPVPTTKPTVTPTSAIASVEVDFDLAAYRAQTEKEMKRLLKYAGKWKEQARKDAENANELQVMVEKLRAENGQLSKRLQALEKVQQTVREDEERRTKRASVDPTRQPSVRLRPQRKPSVLEEKVNQALMDRALENSALPSRKEGVAQSSQSRILSDPKPRGPDRHIPARMSSDITDFNGRTLKNPINGSDNIPSPPKATVDSMSLKGRVVSLPVMPVSVSVRQRVQDRRAAIRAKLQAGLDEKPSSAQVAQSSKANYLDRANQSDHDSDSQLDWADLA